MTKAKLRIAISGDYLQDTTVDRLMSLGFDELLPYQDLLAWEFLPKARYGEEIDSRQLEGFDALMLAGQHVTANTLSPTVARRLIAVARMGAGTDNIDLAAAVRADVVVFTSPHGLTHSTALGALSLLLCAGRELRILDRLVREGRWDERSRYIGADFLHHTVGVIGPGRIGRELLRLLTPFQMRVLAYSPRLTPERARAMGAEAVPLASLMRESDFVCVTCALTRRRTP